MTRQLDIDRILDGFLAEGTEELADRVLEAALIDVNTTKQRRSLPAPWRFAHMNTYAKAALAAAAVVVIAIAGYNLLPGTGGFGGPGATPTLAPSPTARPVGGGQLDPGRYYIDDPARTPVRLTFTLPAGWSGRLPDLLVSKHGDSSSELNFYSFVVTHVYTDACRSEGTLTEVGPTVDDLVEALLNQESSDASAPEEISVDGHPGKVIRMSIPAELDTATCRHPGALIQIWADEAERGFFAIPVDPPETEGAAYIVDVDGERVVIVANHTRDASAADVAELEGILESIEFVP